MLRRAHWQRHISRQAAMTVSRAEYAFIRPEVHVHPTAAVPLAYEVIEQITF